MKDYYLFKTIDESSVSLTPYIDDIKTGIMMLQVN